MPRSLGARYSCDAVGDLALPDPGHEILVHHMAGDPAPGFRIGDRPLPGRDAVLHIRLALLRHAAEMPHDAERVLVIDRHAELDMVAGEQPVRPQADAADRPQPVLLGGVGADAFVLEAVVEFVEIDLDVLRRIGAGRRRRGARSSCECVHSKCTGSIEFSWHWNQLHGISALTIWRKPFFHEKNSQSGTSGARLGAEIGP